MEYYGNNDWRDYLRRQNELMHFGIPKKSGRYPWGSGEDPYHHGADAPGGKKKKKLNEFTPEENRAVGRTTMRYGSLVGLGAISDIRNGRYSKDTKYTEPELDRIARASARSLKGAFLGSVGRRMTEKSEMKKIEADKNLLGDNYKKFSEYTEDQIRRMNEAHEKGKNEYKVWQNVIKENAKALNVAREEAKKAEESREETTQNSDNKSLTTGQKSLLDDAKNNDRYDLGFIEAIQNKQIIEDGHEAERLKAYEEYLRDPEDFWKNKLDKYKDV